MANNFDIKTKTFFQIPPNADIHKKMWQDRVVFMDQGFDLNDVYLITECVQVGELWYQFSAITGYSGDRKLNFDFKRKSDCLMAQRELTRAWTRTGEFAYADENMDSGEGSNPQ